MKKTTVISSDDYEEFECYTDGGYWNGWASVYFTREQLSAWLESTPYDYRFLAPHEAWNKSSDPKVIIYFEHEDTIAAIEARDENDLIITVYPMEGFQFMYADEWINDNE